MEITQASLVDETTQQTLMAILAEELLGMSEYQPGRVVDRLMLVDLNRRLMKRKINELLPNNVVFSGVEVYDETKVRILLRELK